MPSPIPLANMMTGHHVILVARGMGDGIYSAYWGLDSDGEVTELIMPFMNPEFF